MIATILKDSYFKSSYQRYLIKYDYISGKNPKYNWTVLQLCSRTVIYIQRRTNLKLKYVYVYKYIGKLYELQAYIYMKKFYKQ